MLLEVRRSRGLSEDFRLLELSCGPSFARPSPGQFVMVRARATTDPLWRRPLGVHDFSVRGGWGRLSLLFQVVGPGTRDLAALRAGAHVDVLGPFGRGFDEAGEEHWLVAGGRGIAPLFYLARRLRRRRRSCRAFLGGRGAGHVLRAAELERLGCRVEVATEDGSRGRRGLVTELFARALARLPQRRRPGVTVSACGPRGMLLAVAGSAVAAGVRAQVSVDPLMACGLGLCLGCSVECRGGVRKLACTDGPVFPAGELL